MNDRTQSRSPLCWAVLLTLLLLSAQASPGQAAPRAAGVAAVASAGLPGAHPWAAQATDWRALFSDRDTMIQVGVVIGAIAIFLLTRSTK
ncbi:MAG: hypothetical protein L0Z62_05070 [Gemmataceae bacterium]|nr:hypothetical protein [Gemmataceae bacterium]